MVGGFGIPTVYPSFWYASYMVAATKLEHHDPDALMVKQRNPSVRVEWTCLNISGDFQGERIYYAGWISRFVAEAKI